MEKLGFDIGNRLKERCLLASVYISMLGMMSVDRSLTRDVNYNYLKLDNAVGRYVRIKLDKSVLERHTIIAGTARAKHRAMTCAWGGGMRLLMAEYAMKYTQEMHRLKMEYDEATSVLRDQWHDILQAQQVRLGPLYRAEDYPSASELPKHFAFEVDLKPVSDLSVDDATLNLFKDLGSDVDEMLETTARREFERGIGRAVEDVKDRVREVIERLVAVCTEDGKLHDSLRKALENCVVMVLNLAQVTQDGELRNLTRWTVDVLNRLDLDRLRQDKNEKLRYGMDVLHSCPVELSADQAAMAS